MEVMIDIETLATTAKSLVLSIGVVPFNESGPLGKGEVFYPSFIEQTDPRAGEQPREISLSTLRFWLQQGAAAIDAAFVTEDKRVPTRYLAEMLRVQLRMWEAEHGPTTNVWANGDLFDLGIIDDILEWGDQRPWKYNAPSDLRTLMKELYPLGWTRPEPDADHAQHDALSNCRYQVQLLVSARQFMKDMAQGRPSVPGRSVNVSDDGTWLHIDGGHRKASINMEHLSEKNYGSIIGAAIADWCNARRDDAGKSHIPEVRE